MLGGYFPEYRLSIPGPQFLPLSDVYLRLLATYSGLA